MKVLLVNPNVGYYTRSISNPLGLLSIATYLKQAGYEVRVLDRCIDNTNLKHLLQTFQPTVVGVSVMSGRGVADAVQVSKLAKAQDCTVIWGGQMPSLQPEIALDNTFVDLICIGEGEITWKELLEHYEGKRSLDSIHGIGYRVDGQIALTPCRDFADLSEMPVLDWTLVDTEKYFQRFFGCQKMLYLYSSKGCPCRCAFCSNVNFHRSTYRKRPNNIVLDEIEILIRDYGLDGVYFSDELWCMKKSDMEDFCRQIHERNLQFHWGVQVRVGQFEEQDFQTMYEAGCRWVFLGIESGSPEILHRVHKNIDYDRIVPTFQALERVGIISIGSFMIGFPGETAEQLRSTVRLIQKCHASLNPIYHFTPLPGTELYTQTVCDGTYKHPCTLQELTQVIATEQVGQNLSAVPDRDLKVIRSWFHWQGFISENSVKNGKRFEFAKQTIADGLHSISMHGIVPFFVNGFSALREFLYVFWYAHGHKKIRNRYGLTK